MLQALPRSKASYKAALRQRLVRVPLMGSAQWVLPRRGGDHEGVDLVRLTIDRTQLAYAAKVTFLAARALHGDPTVVIGTSLAWHFYPKTKLVVDACRALDDPWPLLAEKAVTATPPVRPTAQRDRPHRGGKHVTQPRRTSESTIAGKHHTSDAERRRERHRAQRAARGEDPEVERDYREAQQQRAQNDRRRARLAEHPQGEEPGRERISPKRPRRPSRADDYTYRPRPLRHGRW